MNMILFYMINISDLIPWYDLCNVYVFSGQFGCVYEATLAKQARSSNDYGPLTHEKVAVKTLKG